MSNVDLSVVLNKGRTVFNRFLQQQCAITPFVLVSAGLGEVDEIGPPENTVVRCNVASGAKTPEKYADIAGDKLMYTVIVPYGTVVRNGYKCDVYAPGVDPLGPTQPTHRLIVIDITDQDTTFGVATSLVCVERT